MAEPRAGADDPRADRADDRLVSGAGRPGEGRLDPHAVDVAAQAGAGRDSGGEQAALAQGPHGVRERQRQGAARELHVCDAEPLAKPGARRGKLAV